MNEQSKVSIGRLATGVPGLDAVLGGGLPEFSFNIIAGAPGSGKTTLAHQIMFANASAERPALYFTVLGEPALKMLRYQQQFGFFDAAKLSGAIRFINLSDVILEHDLSAVLDAITQEVAAASPALVVVDSFRSVVRKAQSAPAADMELQGFVQRLALYLTSWQATTFLVGEYTEGEIRDNPVFTVADGLFWLSQNVERNSIVHKMQIMKLRGQASVPGLHTFRITENGLQVFPRTFGLAAKRTQTPAVRRLSTGIEELDAMLNGGIPEGDSVLVAGPSGTGKSVLATQFIAEGVRRGEAGIVAVFEERPEEYAERAESYGLDLATPQREGTLEILYLRPLDLSVDETLHEVLEAAKRIGAKRIVIDSLAGFEMALAPAFRQDFRESLYRMIWALTGVGVTVLSTVELPESFTDMAFSPHAISFLTDDIIRLRYVEIEGQLCKILVVVKMRGGSHSKDIREYTITAAGLTLGAPSKLPGACHRRSRTAAPVRCGHERVVAMSEQTDASAKIPDTADNAPPPGDLPLASILDSIGEAINILDTAWIFRYVNQAAADFGGKIARELRGKNYWEEFPDLIGSPVEVAYRRAMQEQIRVDFEFYFAAGDKWFEMHLHPSPQYLTIHAAEITRRVHAERRAEHLAEIEALNERLHYRIDELRAVSQALTLSNVRQHEWGEVTELANARMQRAMQESHHRIKNNLQVVAALVEMQIGETGETANDAYLRRIYQHMLALASIHDLLTQQAKDTAEDNTLGTREMLGRLVPLLQETSGGRRITADIADIPLPTQKAASLSLLVSECVSNALKHCKGEVEITLRVEDGMARLEVCDDGTGFPFDFDWRKAANTGLALIDSTARHDLRGEVRYENHAAGGGRVAVAFPVPALAGNNQTV